MKTFLWLTGSGVFFVLAWSWWFFSLPRLWQLLGARPLSHEAVWRQVKERLEGVAREARRPVPRLWLMPEFSPNALIVTDRRGQVHIAFSEGLLRALSGEEIDAILALCLAHGHRRGRWVQSWLALALTPFARWLQGAPLAAQIFLSPWLTGLLRLCNAPTAVFRADRFAARTQEPRVMAAALHKLGVLGRKIPLRHWNFALDSLYLLSPLAVDGGPFWVFLSQPSVEARRLSLLDSHS